MDKTLEEIKHTIDFEIREDIKFLRFHNHTDFIADVRALYQRIKFLQRVGILGSVRELVDLLEAEFNERNEPLRFGKAIRY